MHDFRAKAQDFFGAKQSKGSRCLWRETKQRLKIPLAQNNH
jgi:hypothetical protein